ALGATVGLRDYDEQSLGSRLVRRTAWWRARRNRANVYRSGPLGRTHWGSYQLPGLLAGSRLSEHMDSYGRPFALVHVPSRGHWTVVMAGDPNGDALVDEDRIHRQVASWGDYLREMGFEPAIEQVTVTLESVPATRAKLRREVQSRMDADASEFAREMLAQTVAGAHDSSPDLNAYVALTGKGSVGGRRRAAEEVGEDVASRLPMLTAGLERAGMTDVRPVRAPHGGELGRVSYGPARVTLMYRPISPYRAAHVVESDKRNAMVRANSDKGTAAGSRALQETTQTAEEQAAGHGLTNFSMLVTATVEPGTNMREVQAGMDELGAGRVRLRPAYGSQAGACAASVPVGVVCPSRALRPPDT